MTRTILWLLPLLYFLVVPGLAGSEVDFNPGLWEMTWQVSMPGMSMPPITSTKCLKQGKAELRTDQKHGCRISERATSGNTVTWTVACSGKGGVSTGKVETNYRGSSFEGTVSIQSQGLDMLMEMSGRRIGECT